MQQQKMQEKKHNKCIKEKTCKKTYSKCESELRSESRPTEEISRLCSKKVEDCKQKYTSRSLTKSILYRLKSGYATTFSSAVILSGENQQNKKFEAHVSVGQSDENSKQSQTEVDLTLSYSPSSSSSPLTINLRSSTKMDKPTSKWNKESILSQNLGGQVDIQTCYGYEGKHQDVLSMTIKSSQSEEQKKYATESYEHQQCQKHVQQGQKLTQECELSRAASGSLDVHEITFSLPSTVSKNKYVKSVSELFKALASPFLKYNNYKQQYRSMSPIDSQEQYVFTFQVQPHGKTISLSFKTQENEYQIDNIRVPKELQGLLPLNVRDSSTTNIMQKLTSGQSPSTCSIESGYVKTFDNVKYEYGLNDCEHVIFKDCSQNSRVEVSVQQKSSSKKVKVYIDGHKYEIKVPSTQSELASIKVNNEEKTYVRYQDLKYRQQSMQKKVLGEQKDQSEFVELTHNYYADKDTYVTSYEDGVYSIVSKLYGFSVYVDKDSIEVKTYQHILRNRACGLCGDLNDETTADVKSAKECVMSSPKLSAFTYMIQDSSCQGVPSEYQQQLTKETEQCVKKVTYPTQVTKVYSQPQTVSQKHLSEEKDNKICISKETITVCSSSSNPEEVQTKKVSSK